jgi:putative redox protein
MMKSTVTWTSGLAFTARQGSHSIPLDASKEAGGMDSGASPKALLLSGLGGCTGIDVVSILEKMRVPFKGLEVQVSADLTEEHPRVFRSIHLRYGFRGRDLPMEKLEKAVILSMDRYCGVSAMLAKAAPISWEITVEE